MGNCTIIFTAVDLRVQNSFPNSATGPASYFLLHDTAFPSIKRQIITAKSFVIY